MDQVLHVRRLSLAFVLFALTACTRDVAAPPPTDVASPTPTPVPAKTVEIASVQFAIPDGWKHAGTVFTPTDLPPGKSCELRVGPTESASKPDPWFDGAWRALVMVHTDVDPVPRAGVKRPTFDIKSVGASMTDKEGRRFHALFIALVNEPAARAMPLVFLCDDHPLFESHRELALDLLEGATWLEGDVPLAETPLASGGWKTLAAPLRKN